MKKNNKIDVIIPAYKAHKTILKTLCSIAEQTIISDINVVIVNDNCPEGSYQKFVDMFKPYMNIEEIILTENVGPGQARQKGISHTENEFLTFIDADDTFAGSISLDILRTGLTEKDFNQIASGTFVQLSDTVRRMLPHQNDMVWMFGKLYRRSFIERYNIAFNETRANEDTGFNTIVRLLCDNPNERIRFIPEITYYWHNKEDSITRINDGQYGLDQCFCGWTDNMIYAINHVKKLRPFSGSVRQWIVNVMLQLYYYWIETEAKKPIFSKQNWEYVKKFYNTTYKKIEEDISEQVFSEMFSMCSMEKYRNGSLIGFIPSIGIKEFMNRLKDEPYNEDDIYDIWEEMKNDPEAKKLIENNEKCGVCKVGYTNKPF